MKKICLLALLMMLPGCSMFSSGKPFPLEEVGSQETVKDCRKVATYPGPKGYRMYGTPTATATFKLETAEKAKAEGATHIFWDEDVLGVKGQLIGYAYDCTGVLMGTQNDEDEDE
jgi:hypothetical protein